MSTFRHLLLLLVFVAAAHRSVADDGYRLWLKYDRLADAGQRAQYQKAARFIAVAGSGPVLRTAAAELQRGLQGLLGQPVPVQASAGAPGGGIVLKVDRSAIDASTPNAAEGYRIYAEKNNLVVASPSAAGVLYGAYAVLRRVQTSGPLAGWAVRSAPRIRYRMLNHWDNPNGTVERGYAGSSIWKWDELPQRLDPRYTDYARANASVGITGVAINNVNASAHYLTPEYLPKVAALAGVMRPYSIRVYLSVFWAAPKVLGGLPTADPLDPAVQRWWAAKTDEIYRAIPDFGGFLVKANSEASRGPRITSAPTPTAPTCWPRPWGPTTAW